MLNELDMLFDANPAQARGLAAVYEFLLGGVPNQGGFTFLINANNASNFGAGPGTTFNGENIYINVANALVQGNDTAASNFQAIVGGGATLSDKIEAIYRAIVPVESQTDEGLAYLTRPEGLQFYMDVAAQRGVAGADGAAIVALSSLLEIAVREDLGGIGDSVNDFIAAVNDGSAVLPETGDDLTPIETADGTNFDGDDIAVGTGDTFTLTDGLDQLVGTDSNDVFQGETTDYQAFDSINGAGGTDTLNLIGDFTAPSGGSISNVEVINLLSNTNAVDADDFGAAAQQIWQINSAGDIDDLEEAQVAGFRNLTIAGNDTGADTADDTDDVDAENVSVGFNGSSASIALDNVTFGAGEDATVGGTAVATSGSLTINGDDDDSNDDDDLETLSVSGSLADDGVLNLLDGGNDVTISTFNLSMTSDVEVTGDAVLTSDLTTFNAAGTTGDVTVDLSAATSLETATFGAGADDVTAAISDDADTAFVLGAGNDTFTLDGSGDSDNSLTTITLGAGNDTFAITTALSNIADASEDNFADGLITVTDFNAGEDVIDLSALAFDFETLINTESSAINDADSLYDAVVLAASYVDTDTDGGGGDTDDAQAVAFNYGGNAYIFNDADDSGTFSDDDGLVQLTGVSVNDLDASNFVTA